MPPDLRLEIIDELDQKAVALFVEKLYPQKIRKLLLRRHIYLANTHEPLLQDVVYVKTSQSNLFSTRDLGLANGYM